jgi:hypothetical protein
VTEKPASAYLSRVRFQKYGSWVNAKTVLVDEVRLNELGKQGWELVGVAIDMASTLRHQILYLRREVRK